MPDELLSEGVRIGAVTFVYGNLYDSVSVEPPDDRGRYAVWKMIAVVAPGTTVLLEVPEGEQHRMALVYAEGTVDAPQESVADAQQEVVLESCTDRSTQFNGGIVVTEPMCAQIVVTDEGGEQERGSVSIGAGGCP